MKLFPKSLVLLLFVPLLVQTGCGKEAVNNFSKELKALFWTDEGDFRGVSAFMTEAEVLETEVGKLEVIKEPEGKVLEGEINLSDASGHLDASALLSYYLDSKQKVNAIIVTVYLETSALKKTLGTEIPAYLENKWGEKPEKKGSKHIWNLKGKQITFSKLDGIEGDYKIAYLFSGE